jgi:hypothetical protein
VALLNRNLLKLAHQWAEKLGTIKASQHIVAQETLWGFEQVEGGRDPDSVLKDIIERINLRARQEGIARAVQGNGKVH